MNKKYQIFISSTFKDLIQERQEVLKTILDLGQIPAGMEAFPAADIEQFEYIKKIIDECDYYTLIVGARYGTLDEEGISYTEKEYDYAVSRRIPVLAFINNDIDNIPVKHADRDPQLVEKLNVFRNKISRSRLVRYWNNVDSLKASVSISIIQAISQMPATGWIRGDAVASEDLLRQINNLRNEKDDLEKIMSSYTVNTSKNPDLADFTDETSIRYTSKTRDRINDTIKSRLNLTWLELFKAIGPNLIAAKSPSDLKSYFEIYIREKSNNLLSVYANATDVNNAKIHLNAMGLIDTYEGTDANGVTVELIKLTQIGKSTLLEMGSQKKSGG